MLRKTLAVVALLLAPALYAGAPLKGVDVKLGKNPGGSPAKRTTGADGKFDFGVLPAGSYSLTLSVPSSSKEPDCEIEINGAEGGTIKAKWDLQKGKRVYPSNERRADEATIILNSDGKHPLNGTIVKSKSNISNN
jgi:hypothetical protein